MKKIEVKFDFNVNLNWGGTIDITQEQFDRMKGLDDAELVNALLPYINMSDPTDWSDETINVFEEVK